MSEPSNSASLRTHPASPMKLGTQKLAGPFPPAPPSKVVLARGGGSRRRRHRPGGLAGRSPALRRHRGGDGIGEGGDAGHAGQDRLRQRADDAFQPFLDVDHADRVEAECDEFGIVFQTARIQIQRLGQHAAHDAAHGVVRRSGRGRRCGPRRWRRAIPAFGRGHVRGDGRGGCDESIRLGEEQRMPCRPILARDRAEYLGALDIPLRPTPRASAGDRAAARRPAGAEGNRRRPTIRA